MNTAIQARLTKAFKDLPHPAFTHLIKILTGKTSLSSSGYPYIAEAAFQLFLGKVPHLFEDGRRLLDWLNRAEKRLEYTSGIPLSTANSIRNTFKVLKTVVQTAAVCAPTDLWLLRRMLSTYQELGVCEELLSGTVLISDLEKHHALQHQQLTWDFQFMQSRGYLIHNGGERSRPWRRGRTRQVPAALKSVGPLAPDWRGDLAERLANDWGKSLEDFLIPPKKTSASHPAARQGWVPTLWESEIGFRLVPAILALHQCGILKNAQSGALWSEIAPKASRFAPLLRAAGIVSVKGTITEFGERTCQRGTGPFGIIHAYHSYMDKQSELLRTTDRKSVWVDRGKNVAASQNANRKTFELANAALDRFCKDTGFNYSVFIEHALGQGEATRQRYATRGLEKMDYFGADLEDAAIDRAEAARDQGLLPSNMTFIRNADIGRPELVIDVLRAKKVPTKGAVMIVGNGFHEVRGQDDQKMIRIFKGYADAGFILLFTEESELTGQDLIHTGWNTYHAGFRYTHQISGQGLRSSAAVGTGGRLGWPGCVEKAGYMLLRKYSERTRTVYPHAIKGRGNPPISMTYFCVPKDIWKTLCT